MTIKQMRGAFIRVTEENNLADGGKYVFKEEDIEKKITINFEGCDYWFIKHDENEENVHYHILLDFKGRRYRFDKVKKVFPYGKIENPKNYSNCIRYLIHYGDKEKAQYKKEDIKTNNKERMEEAFAFKNEGKRYSREREEAIFQMLIDGELTLEEILNSEDLIWVGKNLNKIKEFLKIGEERKFKLDRDLEVLFIGGESGTGKTLLAKKIAESLELSYYVSGGKKDIIQGYNGQDVLILDDIRDSTIEFIELLKILDNNTNSLISSRYKNIAFKGKMIIITSAKPLEDWYAGENSTVGENRFQFFRRIGFFYNITKSTNGASKLNIDYDCYELMKREEMKENYYTMINAGMPCSLGWGGVWEKNGTKNSYIGYYRYGYKDSLEVNFGEKGKGYLAERFETRKEQYEEIVEQFKKMKLEDALFVIKNKEAICEYMEEILL